LAASHGIARRLRLAAYVLVAFIAVSSFSEIIASTWPPQLHDPRWRIGVTTFVSSATPLNLLAIFICIAVAFAAGDRRVLWAIGAVCGTAALAYLLLSAEFALDLLQLRRKVRPDLVTNYDVTMALGELRLLLASAASFGLSIAAFRVRRHARHGDPELANVSAGRFFMGNVAPPEIRSGSPSER